MASEAAPLVSFPSALGTGPHIPGGDALAFAPVDIAEPGVRSGTLVPAYNPLIFLRVLEE